MNQGSAPVRRKRPIPMASRRALAERYGATVENRSAAASCAYCGAPGDVYRHSWGWATFGALEIDHIIPESLGGSSEPDNLTLACRPCNRRKGANIWPIGGAHDGAH